MKGKQYVHVTGNRLRYDFELNRSITIVRGNSGSGKTTLFEMIADYSRYGEKSAVRINADKKCVALTDSDWQHQLTQTTDSIVFIDEGADFLSGVDFARAVKQSDNYYVIFNREDLHNLPYSVDEIYEIHTSGKNHTFRHIYRPDANYRYSATAKNQNMISEFVTEDSKSGFEFFKKWFESSEVKCFAAGANSSVFFWLQEHKDCNVFVLADGAAFGAEMSRVMHLQAHYPNIVICLPESFEWLVLKSGLVKAGNLENILENPSEYIDTKEYFSWEQFFADYLVQATKDTYYPYEKSRLHPFYCVRENSKKIVALIGLPE